MQGKLFFSHLSDSAKPMFFFARGKIIYLPPSPLEKWSKPTIFISQHLVKLVQPSPMFKWKFIWIAFANSMCQRRIIVRSWEVSDICKWKPEQYSNVLIALSHDRCWKLHLMSVPKPSNPWRHNAKRKVCENVSSLTMIGSVRTKWKIHWQKWVSVYFALWPSAPKSL